jgi:hypothetical protein
LPDEIIDWLENFNNGEEVEPIEFEIDFDLEAHETRRAGRR